MRYAIAFVLLSASLAGAQTPPPAPKRTCVGQLSLWTPAETGEVHQWLQPAARGEGECEVGFSVQIVGRGDLYALPNAKSAPSDLQSAGAGEVWVGLARRIYGGVSVIVFEGYHVALDAGALKGGASWSSCVGAKINYGTDYSVVGVCDRYRPLGPGVAVVQTIVVPVKGVLGAAVNYAVIPSTGKKLIAAGPLASWK